MFDKLLSWLVQEIPEELSVCEFECCKTECTMSDWAVCRLRRRSVMRDGGVIWRNVYAIETEATA